MVVPDVEASTLNIPPHASGASSTQSLIEAAESVLVSRLAIPPTPQDAPKTGEGEDTLEWHEVIELQAFSERKAWIEDKIKLLEQMPPIEVFAGMDAVRSSAETTEGLPSREELQQWVIEHDKIEKETEIFDSGELKKLKKFTKAAASRNLSPADTDLIELTLTTIYELDKLMRLLRDRSDNLELLSVRLTWEERRISAWVELRNMLADIKQFLSNRARWSPAIYDQMEDPSKDEEPNSSSAPLRRKGSTVSLASVASESQSSPAAFSRSARYKLSELLSRDAAQYASRVSSLRHSKINPAGKTLDRLIDDSRRPVPEELLDEQDRLEDKGINEMEDVGKFIMNVVMQWKKSTAQALLEEIEFASVRHPTARQDTSFISRTNSLMKRLEMRGDPSSSAASFPCPSHPLFPDQIDFNESLLELLSSELRSASELATRAELSAKRYHADLEAARRVETLCKASSELSAQLTSFIARFEKGDKNSTGDGTPPDLSSEDCLQTTRHSLFLALLPSLSDGVEKADVEASKVLQSAYLALSDLNHSGVDPQFVIDSKAQVDNLAATREQLAGIRKVVTGRVTVLREVRRIWTNMEAVFNELETSRQELSEGIEQSMWKPQSHHDAALLTPESSIASLPPPVEIPDTSSRFEHISSQLQVDVSLLVSSSIESRLKSYLEDSSQQLASFFQTIRLLASLMDSVRNQASAMTFLQEEVNDLQLRIEDLRSRFEVGTQDTLSGRLSGDELVVQQATLDADLSLLHDNLRSLLDSFSLRVPFIANSQVNAKYNPHSRRPSLSAGFSLEVLRQCASTGLAVDPVAIDRTVRADCNAFSILLSGAEQSLSQHAAHFRLAKVARAVDIATQSLMDHIHRIEANLSSLQQSAEDRPTIAKLETLTDLSESLATLASGDIAAHASSLISARDELRSLSDQASSLDSATRASLVAGRQRDLDDAESRFNDSKFKVEELTRRISNMRAEIAREEETRAREENERLAREAAEKAEKERLAAQQEAEERLRQEVLAERERFEKATRLEAEVIHVNTLPAVEEDVFAAQTSVSPQSLTQELSSLQDRIYSLRTRLRSLGIMDLSRPSRNGSLPTPEQCNTINEQLTDIADETENLPSSVPDNVAIDTELHSLRVDVENLLKSMIRVNLLAKLRAAVENCDNALSDLLEHIDSYPSPPTGVLSSSYTSDTTQPSEAQLDARLSFTEGLINDMTAIYDQVKDDPRAVSEHDRLLQTWGELQAMGQDRLSGRKSRPASVMSSGRSSRASAAAAATTKKSAGYSKLSSGSPGGQLLAPPPRSTRRSSSGASTRPPPSRSSSRMSVASNRSVSGPIPTATSRLYQSTFASRQRTTSVTSTTSAGTPTAKPALPRTSRPRARTNEVARTASPAFSDISTFSLSRPSLNVSRSSQSTWARAPRESFPSFPRSPPLRATTPNLRKRYVPNPKNKLDVAVGDVVNKLPMNVNINIEVVADTWKDQSGKYWIGDQDPKLCFCRILRSQTVMVRVGGGWAELSKFIKDHFADAFRLLPESPPRARIKEEKWISSATLAQAAARRTPDLPAPPRTPEPSTSIIPSFALSTPSGRSPQGINASPSPGSPLTAMQFIRRADRESPAFRSETPTKSSHSAVVPSVLTRAPAWRP
ncbi:unnamed protein product [Somion occarium]|uniref:GAR domain-containing protein n=1 Tax=Somion occarium TaxID=3059160 RepID=A0ABP1D628_9APHY